MQIPSKKTCFFTLFTLFLILYAHFSPPRPLEDYFFASSTLRPPTIIIDAGHGGEDGGAVSDQGAIESHINLAIALDLEQVLALYGRESLLLREEDLSLHNEEATTFQEMKRSDLENRVAMVNQVDQGLLISIHQNAFPQSKYSGAQVFYTPDAQDLAVQLQKILRDSLDENNKRSSKPVDSGIYLMNHVTCPALLVECGFLSNPAEAALLETEGYQRKIACAIATALLQQSAVPT